MEEGGEEGMKGVWMHDRRKGGGYEEKYRGV